MMIAALLAALSFSQTPAPAATGLLTGRVTVEGANTPIAGARIILIPAERLMGPMGMPPQTLTDQDGRFVFDKLAPGSYRIDAQKNGFASLNEPGWGPTPPAQVAAGQTVEISLQLQRGGVIAGKVLDSSGEPATDAQVMAWRRLTMGPPGTPPRLVPAPMHGSQQLNDLAEFRVAGLAPGEYFLSASPRGMGFGGLGMASTTGHGGGTPAPTTTYYPGTADQAGAQPITVAAGAEVSNIVFALQSAPAYRVSGIVVDESGAPIAHAMVMLMTDPRSGMMFLGPRGNAQTGDDGRFSIGDVTPGAYRLNASVMIMSSGGGIGASSVATGGGSFTSWSISGGGVTTTSTVNGVTTTSTVNAAPPQPQEVVITDADVKGVRVVARRPPTPQ